MRKHAVHLAAQLLLAAALTAQAHAHAGLEKSQASPGSYKAVLKIPHGCEGQATNSVVMTIPDGYVDVKPMMKPGWQIATRKGDYARTYTLHGKEVTSGVLEVTWSGGDLPDDFFDEFVVSGTIAADAGAVLHFPSIQKCAGGEVAWDQVAAEGQDPHELEHPAPTLTVVAGGDHDHAAMNAVKAGEIEITAATARVMLPNQPAGTAYFTVTNKGDAVDRLVAVSSPSAGKVEIHEMKVDNGVMIMRPVEGGIEIPAGATVELKPGGMHLMFMQGTEPFMEGGAVPVTLEFEKAGKMEMTFPVTGLGE